jgi:hypothetical protein
MIRITYLRNTNWSPVVCLAFDHKKDAKTFKYQMAVHNPKDKCIKKVAVATATERLNSNPIELEIPTDLDASIYNSATLCKIAIARHIIRHADTMPKRAVKMAQSWNPD